MQTAGTNGITIILYMVSLFDLKGVTSNHKITSVTNGPNKNMASYKRSPKKYIRGDVMKLYKRLVLNREINRTIWQSKRIPPKQRTTLFSTGN